MKATANHLQIKAWKLFLVVLVSAFASVFIKSSLQNPDSLTTAELEWVETFDFELEDSGITPYHYVYDISFENPIILFFFLCCILLFVDVLPKYISRFFKRSRIVFFQNPKNPLLVSI